MKHTKANIIRVLEASRNLEHSLANHDKENGDIIGYNNHISIAIAYGDAINIINDKKYFEKLVDIFRVEEE